MKILAVDSSGMTASVAVLEDDIVRAEYSLTNKKTHSETLLPMIDRILSDLGMEPMSLDAIAIAAGPGSFTGLRIGASTIKGLSLSLEIPVVPVPTLMALAENVAGSEGLIAPIMDARRNQVFTGIYRSNNEENVPVLETVRDQDAKGIDELIEELNELTKDSAAQVTFLGDGVKVFRDYIKENAKFGYRFANEQNNLQRAGSVAVLAARLMKENKQINGDDFAPIYLRKSQAEREREAAEQKASE